MSDTVMERLACTISQRRLATAEASYTRSLLDGGREKCARKFGEEAVETVIAGLIGDREAVTAEAADTIYHLLVLLEMNGVSWAEVSAKLTARMGVSGHDEKAARSFI